MKFYQLGLSCLLVASAMGQTRVDLRTQTKSVDFSGASSTKPSQTGTILPATCSVGQTFFNTAAPAGQNLYACTAVNVWTVEGGGLSSLPAPGAATLGGVDSKDCSPGGQFLQKINTDGTETCGTPAGGGNVSGPGAVTNGFLPLWGAGNNLLTAGLAVSTAAAANTVPEAGAGGTLAAGWLPSAGSHTVNTTAPLSGGGAVALGGTLTIACPTCLTANAVPSVFGRTGAVTAQSGDYAAAQITGLAPSATTDTTNAANITGGTLAATRLPVPGVATLGGVQSKDCTSGGQFLQKINTDGTETCGTPAGGGGAVSSVFGRTGAVTAQSGDYTQAQLEAIPSGPMADYLMIDASGTNLPDSSGNGNNGVMVATPTVGPLGVTFDGATQYVNLPSGLAWKTVCMAADFSPSKALANTNSFGGLFGNASGSLLNIMVSPDFGFLRLTPAVNGSSSANENVPLHGDFCYAADATTDHIYIQGHETASYFVQQGNAAKISGVSRIAYAASSYFTGTIYRVTLYSTEITAAQAQNWHAATDLLLRKRGVVTPPINTATNNVLLALGDSITYGYGVTTPWTSLMTLNNTYSIHNFGIDGYPMMSFTDAGQQADNFFNPKAQSNVIVLWACTNDFVLSRTVAQCLTDMAGYSQARRRAGWKVVVVSMLDRTGMDATSAAFNAALRASWPTFADGLADVAANPLLGAAGASTNTTYFSDGTHPTNAGQALYLPIINAAVNRVWSTSLPFPTSSTPGAVVSVDCSSGGQFLQKINTDGTETCATPTGGSGGMADPGANGIVARTALNTTAPVTITAGSGITVANGNGAGNPLISLDTTIGVTQAQVQTLAPLVCQGAISAFPNVYYCAMTPPPGGFLDASNNPLALSFCPATTWAGGAVQINTGLGAKRLLMSGYDPPANALLGNSCYMVVYNPSATVDTVASIGAFELKSPSGISERLFLLNAATTGTTLNKLTKLTGAPSTAVSAATTDTGAVVGITVAGAGTTLTAVIQTTGNTSCVFDGATTAGHYVQISGTVAGDCHDSGSSYPISGQVIGRVLVTNGSAGTNALTLFGPEIQAATGGGGGSPGGSAGQVQVNTGGSFAGAPGINYTTPGAGQNQTTIKAGSGDDGTANNFYKISDSTGTYGWEFQSANGLRSYCLNNSGVMAFPNNGTTGPAVELSCGGVIGLGGGGRISATPSWLPTGGGAIDTSMVRGSYAGLWTMDNGTNGGPLVDLELKYVIGTVGVPIASATTITPLATLTHITGTTAIAIITPPVNLTRTARGGCLVLIPDGAFTTTTAGNIALASTAVVSRQLTMCYDNGTTKWYPSY